MVAAKIHRLSKSQYCKGRKCIKRVWLYNHHRELADQPGEFQQMLFDQGHEVGRLAQQYFTPGELINEDYKDTAGAIAHTQAALSSSVQFLFEPAFVFDDILIRVDVLELNGDGTFNLIEVKSTNSIKTEHLDDIAVQKFVLEGAGLKIKKCALMHLNPDYVRSGDIDLNQLFMVEAVDDQIQEQLAEVPEYLKLIRAHLALETEPDADIGSVCKNPYQCEFKSHCWKDIAPDSIHKLTRISAKKRLGVIKGVFGSAPLKTEQSLYDDWEQSPPIPAQSIPNPGPGGRAGPPCTEKKWML